MKNRELIDQLNRVHSLKTEEWEQLLSTYDEDDLSYAKELACKIREEIFGKNIYFRGIIEFSNFCKCDCYYCGIRKSNSACSRYRLALEDILECWSDGMTITEIANELGLSKLTVIKILKKNNL